jgi:hypothetical protein
VLRVDVAELGLPALDALDADAIAVLVGPERPLQGLAGFVDWRLCGALSRAIRAGRYGPESGEALLLTTGGRLPVPRAFCFGLPVASGAELRGGALANACERVCDALRKAGSAAFASALPPHRAEDAPLAARLWLEAALRHPVPRQVLLGDPRLLQRDLEAARAALGAAVEVVTPTQKVSVPARARGLSPPGAVLR